MKTLLIAFLFLSIPLRSATLMLPQTSAGPAAPVDTAKVAVIAVDMWNWHWCKTSSMRVGALVPRMNVCLEELRKMGVQVFLCPTDVADNYVGTPMVEKVLAVPPLAVPKVMK